MRNGKQNNKHMPRDKANKQDFTQKGLDQSPTNEDLRSNSKSKSRKMGKLDSKGYPNDPNYYFTSPELAQQAAQLSFQNVLGLGKLGNYEVPSIMTIHFNPSFGNSYPTTGTGDSWTEEPTETNLPEVPSGRSAINAMGDKLYTLLSQFTGRTANYAPQDIIQMIGAVASVAEATEHLRRAFGVILTYNERNRAIPNLLVKAMGIDYADLASNFSNYRMRFNTAIARINQIPLLDNIMYIRKSRELYQRVFTDSPSPMAQIFVYVPRSVWTLQESHVPEGSILETTDFVVAGVTKTMSQYLDIVERMITNLVESSTLNMIYADILNMSNKLKTPLWHFDYLAENYVVMPEYNVGAILQWHNMDIVGVPNQWTTGILEEQDYRFTPRNDVYPDVNNNGILYNPLFPLGSGKTPNTLVDVPSGDPDITDRIEALRMSACDGNWVVVHNQAKFGAFRALSDHYVTTISIYGNLNGNSISIINEYLTNRLWMCKFSQFENGPIMQSDSEIVGSLNYYTTVPYEYLKRVNELMMMGLLDFRVGK